MTEPTTPAPNQNTTNNLVTTSSPSNTVDLAAEMEPYFLTSAPCLFLSFVTGVLNTFVIDYYWRSRRSFVPLLYILISGVDILTAVGIAHQSITTALFTRDIISQRALDHNAVFGFTLISLCYKSSIFYNVVLAVSRTVVILRPFHQIKVKLAIATCVIYGLACIGVAGYDVHKAYMVYKDFSFTVYYISPVLGAEIMYLLLASKAPKEVQNFVRALLLVVPYLLPVLITLVTSILQVISLHSPNLVTSNNQRHVTITIVLMSALFVVCNSAFSVFILIYYYRNASQSGDLFVVFTMTFGTVLPILNAALNPVIIISRSKGLREGFLARVRRIVKRKVEDCDRTRVRMSVLVNEANVSVYNDDSRLERISVVEATGR
jgi:hypothetical protein